MKRKHPLRRIVVGTAATVSGVVLLLALKQPGSGGGQTVAQNQPGQAPPVAATAPPGGGGAGAGAGAGDARTVTGDVAQTQYGPVQVSLTVSGGKITAAQAVKTPNSGPQSEQIAKDAVPKLNQQAVTAAKVDTVSGATYTSEGYAKSLQSALDKAGAR
ncbi:FMN-binding protein [Streptomyces samsunensis]|uniref:FMN-binding protein n=2 Tax=Streptomyces TaxID=1883 RepID=A0ABX6WDP9_STRMQ|nr:MULTISPECIES: FMN-binding protein [Streptomyces]AQA15020.1 FMN-binding protein [Streptomyces autolyticus]MCC4315868.1 FMN-binding protein [Streptomyces malaysiensis]MCM3805226.1 FMN-binding protein [Streptomyces sp. DR7-3]MCQ6248292.1 FMN-binding protein [Streptomyces malaysiensis]NUH37786.1 FMN-binding protein [Streptomyces samsunensis]